MPKRLRHPRQEKEAKAAAILAGTAPAKKKPKKKKSVKKKRPVGRPRYNFEFEEARELVRHEGIESLRQYARWWLHNKPARIPKRPDRAYKNDWVSWNDFLGSTNKWPCPRTFRSFVDARTWAQQLGLHTKADWFDYVRAHDKPEDIPTRPDLVYIKEWFTWRDFVGGDKKSIKRNIEAADAIFFIIQNQGRPNNVFQLGITLEGKETVLQSQHTQKFRIIGMYTCEITFEWEKVIQQFGRQYWESNRKDEYLISNLNEFLFNVTDFVTPVRVP
jgi:hypothetical protein